MASAPAEIVAEPLLSLSGDHEAVRQLHGLVGRLARHSPRRNSLHSRRKRRRQIHPVQSDFRRPPAGRRQHALPRRAVRTIGSGGFAGPGHRNGAPAFQPGSRHERSGQCSARTATRLFLTGPMCPAAREACRRLWLAARPPCKNRGSVGRRASARRNRQMPDPRSIVCSCWTSRRRSCCRMRSQHFWMSAAASPPADAR